MESSGGMIQISGMGTEPFFMVDIMEAPAADISSVGVIP